MSRRLEHVLRSKKIARLGDLKKVRLRELLRVKACGKKTLDELFRLLERIAAGEFHSPSGPFSPSETRQLLRNLNEIIAKLPQRDRDMLQLRFGAKDNRVATLEEIGAKSKLTRERVRPILQKAIPALRKEGGPLLVARLGGVAARCGEMVCPLTPELLAQWLGSDTGALPFALGFYVRILGQLNSEIPAWPKGQQPSQNQRRKAKAILNVLHEVLQHGTLTLPLSTAMERTRDRVRFRKLRIDEFLLAVKHAKTIVVQFPQPDKPEVRLRYIRLSAMAKAVLEASDGPLTPEEILSRGQNQFGRELVRWDARTIGNSLVPEKGFYLLGPRAYGLRGHFNLAQTAWSKLRADVHGLLSKENRPISTIEIVNDNNFPWTEAVNAYELAQILREDMHSVCPKFESALSSWRFERTWESRTLSFRSASTTRLTRGTIRILRRRRSIVSRRLARQSAICQPSKPARRLTAGHTRRLQKLFTRPSAANVHLPSSITWRVPTRRIS
jgi:RNA polymerase sigma factor (sigma-70 family)